VTTRSLAALFALPLAAGCTSALNQLAPKPYFDVRFPVAKVSASASYPRTVDPSGVLWYIDDDEIVRQWQPKRFEVIRDRRVRSGTIFWYAGAVYVLDGDGMHFTRVFRRRHTVAVRIPPKVTPLVGAVADDTHRYIIAARATPHALAVADVWRWYSERLPAGVDPFAAALGGGPHGKKFLVVGDQLGSSLVLKDRQSGRVAYVQLPSNACFSDSAATLRVPVDVRGRDRYRVWATSGNHAVSIDLRTNRILRLWDLPGCAMRILGAGPRSVVILVASSSGDGYSSSVARVDMHGVHRLPQYGEIHGLRSGAILDRFQRLWWFDRASNAFICRTPVS
jgi:hypothetical protein